MSDPTPRHVTDLLGGLLGPAGPELTCEECFEYLDRYVELELSREDADIAVPGMHAHLVGCPACAADHDSLHALVQSDRETPDPDARDRRVPRPGSGPQS